MDPQACLNLAHDADAMRDDDAVREQLTVYWGWRNKGGFGSSDQDQQARWLESGIAQRASLCDAQPH